MERLALDGGPDEHGPLVHIEPVDAGGEQRLNGRRHGELAVARSGLIREQLLEEERVALGRLDDASQLGAPRLREPPPSVPTRVDDASLRRAARA